jgi:hypothetical protein
VASGPVNRAYGSLDAAALPPPISQDGMQKISILQ